MRPLTIVLSRLIGLFALVLSLAIVLHRKPFVEMASRDGARPSAALSRRADHACDWSCDGAFP
jgi:hypothetical protein